MLVRGPGRFSEVHDKQGYRMASPFIIGGIEAGGTKFLCGIADEGGAILDEIRIPTTTPVETLTAAGNFFRQAAARHGTMAALGIGSFGPLSLRPAARDYGCITSTPKPGWPGTDLLEHFRRTLGVPMVLDTDVNAAAAGEFLFGGGRGLDSFCYVTVGTGIGVGLLIDGTPHGGANHLEGGHIRLVRAPGDATFPGICPYHGDCLEGMACGPAMRARWGRPAEDLVDDHPAWPIAAHYLAELCATLTYTVRPERIILGGGVMRPHIYGLVREALEHKLAGYDASLSDLDMVDYITRPTAGSSAGFTGALALAFRHVTGRWPMHWTVRAPDCLQTESLHS
jgi:fructokinase